MTTTDESGGGEGHPPGKAPGDPEPKVLSAAAQRALAEAAERRAAREAQARATGASPELGGRSGPDPVRYGDWENGGIASDF